LYFNGSVQAENVIVDNFRVTLGDDISISNDVQLDFQKGTVSTLNRIQGSVIIGGSSASRTASAFNFNVNVNDFNKVAYQYKNNDYKMYVNGFKAGSAAYNNIFSSGSLQEVNFRQSGSLYNFEGNTKELLVFNRNMTDAEMEDLTSYDSFNEMATEQLYTIE
jgi:hypothetical protein